MNYVDSKGVVYTVHQDLIEVTSMHRPNTAWRFVDNCKHVHQWYAGDKPATTYTPGACYYLPTLCWIVDQAGDDETAERGHYECRICGVYGQYITPQYTSDTYRQYAVGRKTYYINDVIVTEEEFKTKLSNAQAGITSLPWQNGRKLL